MEPENNLKQARYTFSRLGWCYVAGTVVVYLLEALLSYVMYTYNPEWLNNNGILMILSTVIVYGCGMPLIALLVKGMEVQKPQRHEMKWWEFLLAFMMCYALTFVSNLIGLALTTAVGIVKGGAVDNNVADVVGNGNMLINFVSMVVLAPIIEELVFRKLIVDRTVKYGQGIAILTSGLMFGLFHGNLNQFAYAAVLGCFFAFLYIRTGNVKITIGLHAIINFMGSMIIGGLMKMVGYEQLLQMDPNDTEVMATMFTENIAGWMLFLFYISAVFGIVIAGTVFCIVFFTKMRMVRQATDLTSGQGFKAFFGSVGMIVFFVVWMALIVIQLFG